MKVKIDKSAFAKASVDEEKCIGCGACTASCSDVFELGDDGKAHVKKDADCSKCDCKSVVENCPVNAISIIK